MATRLVHLVVDAAEPLTVLADPDGNEFCALSPR
jgi:hypothetical protein